MRRDGRINLRNLFRTVILTALLCLCFGTGCDASAREESSETDNMTETAGVMESVGMTESDGMAETGGESETDRNAETAEPVVYLSMATSGNWQNILRGTLWDKYCEKLEEWSGGTLVMRTYANGTLGNDLELIEGVTEGTLCIINSVPSYQITVVPEAALLDVPGMFSGTEEYNFFMENYYKETIQSYYHEKGLRLLNSSAYDFRILTSNVPVHSMNDLRGLKLRTMENKYQVAFWEAMGAAVNSMNFNQFMLAIQQELLQAQENPLGYMVSSGLSEVQDQVILTNHVLMVSNFVMNEAQYEALSGKHKALLERFIDEMSRELAEKQPQENSEMIGQLTEEGIAIYDAPEDIRQAITWIGQPAVLELLRKDLGTRVVDDYLSKVIQAKTEFRKKVG